MLTFDFDEYFADPFAGPYALKNLDTCKGVSVFILCDGGRVIISLSGDGWRVDDTRKSMFYRGHVRNMKIFKRYGNALSYVAKLNALEIEKILQSA